MDTLTLCHVSPSGKASFNFFTLSLRELMSISKKINSLFSLVNCNDGDDDGRASSFFMSSNNLDCVANVNNITMLILIIDYKEKSSRINIPSANECCLAIT